MMILRQPLFLLLLLVFTREKVASEYEDDDGSESIEIEPETPPIVEEAPAEEIPYTTPRPLGNYYIAEHFDDRDSFHKRWVRSEAKKDDADDSIAKYNGKWEIEAAEKNGLSGDLGLALKSKAHHHAIAARLEKSFLFDNKPFILQYEVLFQNGQECGGAYLKLLSDTGASFDLKTFQDKTPYTIMFGPDKCGTDNKLHFIFRHRNPRTGQFEEKHWKRGATVPKLDDAIKDKKPHLFTLVINPDNTFEVLLDKKSVQKGSLLEDFNPPVNPPAEIDDPNDKKPEDWDEREKIPDPTATKPDDWDEDAPRQIPDPTSQKPSDWLDDEPELIPDPNAEKPKDWDEEMDGVWEPPLISNPKCESVGCGEWKPAVKDNPAYKGKWRPSLIDNPNYKGKWKPKKIPNPDFFEDLHPYKMTPIGAVGLELWSMSDNILFDNIIITDDLFVAEQWALETWALKKEIADRETDNVLMRLVKYTNKHPWLWAVYIVVIALPVVLFISFCCTTKETEDKTSHHKKTDEATPEDVPPTVKESPEISGKGDELPPHAEVEEPEEVEENTVPPGTTQKEDTGAEKVEENEEKNEADENEDVEEEQENQEEGSESANASESADEKEEKPKSDDGASGDGKRGSPRKRPKARID